MTDTDLMAIMLNIDTKTERIPLGIWQIVDAVEAAERERCAAMLESCNDKYKTAAYFARLVRESK